MLQAGENETEILLGNKQLLGIFLVVAVLLGVAFTGGFLVGRGSPGKKNAAAPSTVDAQASNSVVGQTHTIDGEATLPVAAPAASAPGASTPILGSRKRPVTSAPPETKVKAEAVENGYEPRAGSQYLQVAAVGKDEAEAVADVLHKKGFHAHAVPKPGSNALYRVIIGPVKDAGDLSSTRDALRKTGFREVIVQHY